MQLHDFLSEQSPDEHPDYDRSRAAIEALGIPPDIPHDAIDYARRTAERCTENDVGAMRGFIEYGLPMRFMRDMLIPLAWKRGRKKNLEMVVSPNYSLAIISSAGTVEVGRPGEMPSTRSDKGPQTGERIEETQLAMRLPGLQEPRAPKPTPGAMQSWFLLYYRDAEAREIRAELSRGVGFTVTNSDTGHGLVSDFEPRLFIEPIMLDQASETTRKGSEAADERRDDVEIDVTRRDVG